MLIPPLAPERELEDWEFRRGFYLQRGIKRKEARGSREPLAFETFSDRVLAAALHSHPVPEALPALLFHRVELLLLLGRQV